MTATRKSKPRSRKAAKRRKTEKAKDNSPRTVSIAVWKDDGSPVHRRDGLYFAARNSLEAKQAAMDQESDMPPDAIVSRRYLSMRAATLGGE